MPNKQFCVPHLEWETVPFPLIIGDIRCDATDNGQFAAAQITLLRDENWELKATISGYTRSTQFYTTDRFTGNGNIITGELITGITDNGCQVILTDCIFSGIRIKSWETSADGYYFQSIISFDEVQIDFPNPSAEMTRQTFLYWYLCDGIDVHLDRSTYRNLQHPLKKIRVGYQLTDEDQLDLIGSSRSKDYAILRTDELSCLIAQVPEELIPTGQNGVCIEYDTQTGQGLDRETIKELEYFIGFLLGNPLFGIGHSLIKNGQLCSAFLESPNFIPMSAMPPIHFNRQHDWGNFELLINKFWPAYHELQNLLKLNNAISRYWVARELPLGTNLPIFSGAMELLADNYLTSTGQDKLEYLPQDEYLLLIESVGHLKQNLGKVKGGDIIWSKIAGAYRKGPNEKMTHFFGLLGLDTGIAEKKAIRLRNKMAHGCRDYAKIEAAHEDLVLTRTYQVLFHRVLLKLLGYEDYYIDYSRQGSPSKPIARAAG
jgi:hypothetical protein